MSILSRISFLANRCHTKCPGKKWSLSFKHRSETLEAQGTSAFNQGGGLVYEGPQGLSFLSPIA